MRFSKQCPKTGSSRLIQNRSGNCRGPKLAEALSAPYTEKGFSPMIRHKERIYTHRDAATRQRAEEVVLPLTQALMDRLGGMRQLMHELNGVGIAANQIGLLKRIFLFASQEGDGALVNPVIVRRSLRKESGEEGCLSVPGVFGIVKRYRAVEVRAFTPEGKPVRFRAQGLLARVMQHELDHLNGVLFIDRAVRFTTDNAHAILPYRRKPS